MTLQVVQHRCWMLCQVRRSSRCREGGNGFCFGVGGGGQRLGLGIGDGVELGRDGGRVHGTILFGHEDKVVHHTGVGLSRRICRLVE